jgi:hypothetical protein
MLHAWQMSNLRVGADRCVRPHVSLFNCFSDGHKHVVRLRGRCIACVPRSPDVTRNSVDLSVRLSLPVSDCGYVGRPSPVAGETCSGGGEVYCHRRWCPPCQPPNACWLAVSESWPIRLAALPLNIPPRAALSICFVLNVRLTTQTPRRGGPLCPPARFENRLLTIII